MGERLGRYEVEKRYAVEKEDYDLAKKKKEQMDEYRLKVYQQLELHDLLDAQLLVGAVSPNRNGTAAKLHSQVKGSFEIY